MKRVFFLAGILLTSLCIQAQDPEGDGSGDAKKKKKIDPKFTVLGGLAFSTISGESDSYNKLLIGGQAGFRVNVVDLSDVLSLRAGAEFSMQGAGYDDGGFTGDVRLNYINFPIVTHYQSPGGFYADGGLQPGIVISAKDHYDGMSVDYKDFINTFDLSVLLGGGYQVNENIGIGAQAAFGITNINKKQSGYEPNKDRNLVFSIRGQYTF